MKLYYIGVSTHLPLTPMPSSHSLNAMSPCTSLYPLKY